MHQRRVVITGLGAMTPLGCSVGEYWDGLIHGRSGIDKIKNFDASELPCQIAGEVPEFDQNDFMDRKSARRMPRVAQLAMGADGPIGFLPASSRSAARPHLTMYYWCSTCADACHPPGRA